VLWTNQHYIEQFNLLSGENVFVDVGLVIHYRVADAAAWLYNTQDPESLLISITCSELTEELSRLRLLETITAERNELEAGLTGKIRDSLSRYQTGIEVLSVQVRDAHPPIEVAPDFEMVVSAAIEYETKINVAKGYKNDLIPRARGEAAVEVVSAEAERTAVKNRAAGDAEHYRSIHKAYAAAPKVMRTRLRIETAEEVLPGREKIMVPAEATSGAIELLMTADPGRLAGQ
jgi:membrane protease subunit HflK